MTLGRQLSLLEIGQLFCRGGLVQFEFNAESVR